MLACVVTVLEPVILNMCSPGNAVLSPGCFSLPKLEKRIVIRTVTERQSQLPTTAYGFRRLPVIDKLIRSGVVSQYGPARGRDVIVNDGYWRCETAYGCRLQRSESRQA